ncbi:Flightin [Orchesella cincta]|uniref:Flightin n=1 Tax=Orchesella cincta TaxID=48709 RepID=A0A1D2NFX5_ORCCI|nr:Flightin [Orchesella cincta]
MGDADAGSYSGVAPKKKITQFVHWARPKSSLYEYNYDYGSYYYRPMIDYLDSRSRGVRSDIPVPQYWEERALRSYMDRNRRTQSVRISRDAQLLQNIRSSQSHYVVHAKTTARKLTVGGF